MSVQLGVLLHPPLTGRGTGYTCGQIAQGMATPAFKVSVVTPRASRFDIAPANTIEVLPAWAKAMPYRWLRPFAQDKVESDFIAHVTGFKSERRAAFIWAQGSKRTIAELRREGLPVFREMINGPRGAAKHILDHAYRFAGLEPDHSISEASVVEEDEAFDAFDYIFCPNELVTQSLLSRGVPPAKLISSSYGWDPKRFARSRRSLPPIEGLTVIFVGSLSIRKGVHLLLDYWAQSRVRGRLVLAGTLDPVIREKCAVHLARDDVSVLDYVEDVGAIYRSGDVFVFPSLEEGGPQVTYEACGCGLPAITTPVGAGRIIRHGREGLVIDPYDRPGWVEALQRMADDPGLRRSMARAALERAQHFQWSKVAMRRREQIIERLTPQPAAAAEGRAAAAATRADRAAAMALGSMPATSARHGSAWTATQQPGTRT